VKPRTSLVHLILVAALALTAGLSGLAAQDDAGGTPFNLETATGTIGATLRMPAARGPVPAVLIIAGSGPTDRNGNNPGGVKGAPFRQLAEALAADGIASVRYDKRGIAASREAAPPESQMRVEMLIADAEGFIEKMRNDPRFSSITVVGHSEGALIGMVAARAARADGFVSISGPGRRLSDIIREQTADQLKPLPALAEANERILKALEAGQTVSDVPPMLNALYRPSVQPYVISEFKYTPAEEFSRLTRPALIIQGTTDIQVSVADARALAAAKPDATVKIIDGMNHVLRPAPPERLPNIATYAREDLPIVADVPAAIAAFVKGLRLPRHPSGERKSPRTVTAAEVHGVRLAVEYGQLGVRNRAIWGALVAWDQPWMPGADEATTLTTSAPIAIGPRDNAVLLPAGDYTLFAQPSETDFRLLINAETFQYHTEHDSSKDLGRVPMTMTRLEAPAELLAFEIVETATGGELRFRWADRRYAVPFDVR
jgi:pimeloyl-ACP methyl ester carboxylesterase